uniref:Thrombospondin-like N-terminal domain-containing protein n=1 Tax=Eptatretus burgeri TaxID=7764 RepID=A0A8C4Q4J4_EPTBU
MLLIPCALPTDVDLLVGLGLSLEPNASYRLADLGVLPSSEGFFLTRSARVSAPAVTVLPHFRNGPLGLLGAIRSHGNFDGVGGVFLLSVRSKQYKLQFGIEFMAGRLVLHIVSRPVAVFDSNFLDGHWHTFALAMSEHRADLYTKCGQERQTRPVVSRQPSQFAADSVMRLGRLTRHATPFEGTVCQLDLVPSARAAANYCNYIRKQCRHADNYRLTRPYPLSHHLCSPQCDPYRSHTWSPFGKIRVTLGVTLVYFSLFSSHLLP